MCIRDRNTTVDLTQAWDALDANTTSKGIDDPITLITPAPSGSTAGNLSVYGGTCAATTVLNNVAQFIVTIAFYDSATPSGISSSSTVGPVTYTAVSYTHLDVYKRQLTGQNLMLSGVQVRFLGSAPFTEPQDIIGSGD